MKKLIKNSFLILLISQNIQFVYGYSTDETENKEIAKGNSWGQFHIVPKDQSQYGGYLNMEHLDMQDNMHIDANPKK